MTNGERRCAHCGASITQEPGGLWYHTAGQVPHPATPRTEAAGVWQEQQARLAAAEARLAALGPLVDLIPGEAAAWAPSLLRAALEYAEAWELGAAPSYGDWHKAALGYFRAYRAARGGEKP